MSSYLPQNVKHNVSVYILLHWNLDLSFYKFVIPHGVGPLCFIKSRVNAAVYQEILEHFMLPSADKLYGDADFLFLT